eukprot:s29_g56.t1
MSDPAQPETPEATPAQRWSFKVKASLALCALVTTITALTWRRGSNGVTAQQLRQTALRQREELWMNQAAAHGGAACALHPGCAGLAGDCCPTWDGLKLGCCFTWSQNPAQNGGGSWHQNPAPGGAGAGGVGGVGGTGGAGGWTQPTQSPVAPPGPGVVHQPSGLVNQPSYVPPDSNPRPQDVHSLMPDLVSPPLQPETDLSSGTLRDPFSELLRPETMQPIYLLPISNGVKQLFTFFVFGFDLKFQPKKGTWRTKVMKFIVSSFVKVGFITLAINSMIHDYHRFRRRDDLTETNYNEILTLMAAAGLAKRMQLVCRNSGTSPNFGAGLGVWGQLRIQSPGAVFREDIEFARYRHLWVPSALQYRQIRFPICPAGARWLSIMKQLYALVLLPYVIPAMFLEFLMSILFCYWIIFQSRLMCLLKCLQIHILMFFCMLAWFLSFGHFGSNGIARYWTSLWPFVYMYLVYIFASFVVPVLMAVIYGLCSGCAVRQIIKGIGCRGDSKREHPGKIHSTVNLFVHLCDADENSRCGRCYRSLERWYGFMMPHRELQLDDEDRELLLRLDEHRLTQDFQFKRNTHTSDAIERIRCQLMKLRARMEGRRDSDSDLSDGEMFPESPRRCWDVIVGEETCEDGDVNVEKDPGLKEDLDSGKEDFNLEDAEVQVVMLTVKAMAEVAIVQAVTVFLVRAFLGNSFSDFVNAMHITIQVDNPPPNLFHGVSGISVVRNDILKITCNTLQRLVKRNWAPLCTRCGPSFEVTTK